MSIIDVGIFACNEEGRIAVTISELAQQTVFSKGYEHDVRVIVLANGCTDDTAKVSQDAAQYFGDASVLEVVDLTKGGKSRTWNRFVHDLSRRDADILIFSDADIALPDNSTIANLVLFLRQQQDIVASSSRPIKDIDYFHTKLGLIERLIAVGGGTTGNNPRTAICGQLYAMRAAAARSLKLPIGLPVEDGFVRHAIITSLFSKPINKRLIDQADNVIHVYKSERKVSSLIRHQIRIVVGSAINAALFSHFAGLGDETLVAAELDHAAQAPEWLSKIINSSLPNMGYGWIPWSFLFGRTRAFLRFGPYNARRCFIAALGFGLDLIAFSGAQIRMALGRGVGYW